MPTQRYKLTITYRGTRYHGWQRQAVNESYKAPTMHLGQDIPTIQCEMTRALVHVVNHPVVVVGASRTDAFVHAKGQVAHFDTDKVHIPPTGLRRAANARLPDDIVIRDVELVPHTFEAGFSAVAKRYQYLVWNTDLRPALFPDLAWHRWQPLDLSAMQTAARLLEGEHDFASFAKPGHGRENTIRTVHACQVSRRGPRVVFGVEGSGFLWNMVRIIVGTIVQIGMGTYPPEIVLDMLAARDRRAAGPTAPAHGLYLQWIRYPDHPLVSPHS